MGEKAAIIKFLELSWYLYSVPTERLFGEGCLGRWSERRGDEEEEEEEDILWSSSVVMKVFTCRQEGVSPGRR